VSPTRCGWILSRFLAAAAAALTVGCGVEPTAPVISAGPPVLVVGDDGTASYRVADTPGLPDLDPVAGDRALVRSVTVEGRAGGWLQCGRFLLAVPAGAFDGTGTITMTMRDSTAMLVDLAIAPEELNHFAVPVLLSLKTTGVDVPADSLALYWFNSGESKWVDMPTEKTLTSATDCMQQLGGSVPISASDSGVSTALAHFSKYSAGKAGW
jgi:hypothetical protein